MADFTYVDNKDGFITVFPENDQAVAAWGCMAEFTRGSGRFLLADLKGLKRRFNASGYTIAKQKKQAKAGPDADLLSELFA